MIAGEVISFFGNNEEPEVSNHSMIELTDWSEPFIELAADVGMRRVYFKFRMSDLVREVEEAKHGEDLISWIR